MTGPTPDPGTARRASFWSRVTLRDVLFFTIPPIALGLWLFGMAVLDYHRIRQYDDWWSHMTSVRKFGWYRVRAALNAPRSASLENRLRPDHPYVETLRIQIDRSVWDRIDSDVAGHWGEWMEANLVDGGRLLPVSLRFRGDGSVHWTSAKKSLTVKTKRGDLYGGFRRMAFSVKDVVPQYAVNSLAPDFGLLGPETRVVPIFLNERFYGLFRFVEPVDESFLRRNRLMPGNVFRGDTAERGEYFKGLPRELFRNPSIWDRVAFNDRPGAIGDAALGWFLADLNGSTFEEHLRFASWLDRAELSRLMALMLIAGDPYHMSGVHNQFWYEDPADGRLHPIVWDLRLLDIDDPPPGSVINRFWRAALRDPRVMHDALIEVSRWLADDRLLALVRERAEAVEARYADHLAYDRLRAGVISPVGSAGATLALLRHNLERLGEWTRDARVAWVASADGFGGWVLDLEVRGRAGVRLAGLDFEGGPPAEVHLWADLDRDGQPDPDQPPLAVAVQDGRWTLTEATDLLAGCAGEVAALEPEPLHYRFFVDALTTDGRPPEVTPVLVNAVTGEAVDAEAWSAGEPIPATTSWHPWDFENARAEPRDVVLAGEVQLDRDLKLAAGDTLTIEPGTTLRIDPDVSIFSRGRVVARGTREAPIVLDTSTEPAPWGAFVLQGPGADDSVFEHVSFLRGSCAQIERVEYKGMVSVHGASDVLFRSCTFGNNLRCDDSINVVQADADLVDCDFPSPNADAIDYDMSTGEIRGCRIEGAGNDAIDLMTASPRIVDARIKDSGDKGISIGEESAPLIFDTSITGCVRGLEVKDRSEPVVLHCEITGNEVGILQQNKNWRYGEPGWVKLAASVVDGNLTDYADADSAFVTSIGSTLTRVDPKAALAAGVEADGADVTWLQRMHGIRTPSVQPGLVGDWTAVPPEERPRVLAEATFAPDLIHPTDGWLSGGNVQRLVKDRSGLTAQLRGPGRFGAEFDWEVDAGAQLVLELGGQDVENVRVTVHTAGGPVRTDVELPGDPHRFRYVTVELPAGRVEGVELSADATPYGGRLTLHGFRLLAPAAGGR